MSSDDTSQIRHLRQLLLDWYLEHKRDLPWRNTRDPYAIWVSEIMLQQTQVDTVSPRYQPFLNRFPTVQTLAQATDEEVCEAWAGLGYYRRARHLAKAARQVVETYQGVVPQQAKELQKLSGIGAYTAGAIASIAFQEQAPIVDGNVARILSRIFALPHTLETTTGKKILWQLSEQLVQGNNPGDFNQAMMELGATVCTPTSPHCLLCPVSKYCKARAQGDLEQYPPKAKTVIKQPLSIAFLFYQNSEGVYLQQRSLDGLWPGLWEMPSAQGDAEIVLFLKKHHVSSQNIIGSVEHTLTHRQVTARIYHTSQKIDVKGMYCKQPLEMPLSTLAKKALKVAMKKSELTL